MSVDALIGRYGLVAVLVGSGIEGEPFALAGGILAHRGSFGFWPAAAVSMAGACLVDQFWFQLARHYRDNRQVRAISRRPAFARSIALLERHPIWFLALFRFAYGVRAVAPVAIGASRIDARLFTAVAFVAAIVWGIAFTALGELAGPLFNRLSERYGGEVEAVAILISIGALAFALRRGPRR